MNFEKQKELSNFFLKRWQKKFLMEIKNRRIGGEIRKSPRNKETKNRKDKKIRGYVQAARHQNSGGTKKSSQRTQRKRLEE